MKHQLSLFKYLGAKRVAALMLAAAIAGNTIAPAAYAADSAASQAALLETIQQQISESAPAESEAPAESTPAESTPAESTPAESTPADSTPADSTPADSTPADSTPAESAPAESAPAESAPAESTPAESAPAESTPAESAPAESAPAESAPAESAPAESTPAESAPAESAPAEGAPATLSSEEMVASDFKYTVDEDGNAQITDYYGKAFVVTVPSSIGGHTVTSIGLSAFSYCSNLTQIILPDSITSISGRAFWGCTGLTQLILPDSVTSIGNWAFYGCTSLTEINIPKNLTSASSAFAGSSITTFHFPEGFQAIPAYMFSGCKSLTQLTLPDSITSIGERAFESCTGLTQLILPDSVTSIGNWAFSGCTSLTEINIPKNLTEASYAFRDSSITTFHFPEGFQAIPDGMFSGCHYLTQLTLPDSITCIGSSAFSGCTSLTEINIPKNLTEAWSAFSNSSITTFHFSEGFQAIPDGMFSGCHYLNQLTLPDSVTSIGQYAFSGCTGLTEINIPKNLTEASYAFRDSSITTFHFPEGFQAIPGGMFAGCKSLTQLTLPDSVTSIGNFAFAGCTGLTEINIPKNLTEASYAFSGSRITTFHFPEGFQAIPGGMFAGCKTLTQLTLPDSVTSIGQYAFRDCTGLTQLTLPDSVTSIGYAAFEGCTSLEEINIPYGVCSLDFDTFASCSALKKVVLPGTLQSIDSRAFSGCSNVTIHSSTGSYAQQYAKVYNIPFKAVDVAADSIQLNAPSGTLDVFSVRYVSEGINLASWLQVTPSNFNAPVIWTSSNPEVATVLNGYLCPASSGSTTITVQIGDKRVSKTITLNCMETPALTPDSADLLPGQTVKATHNIPSKYIVSSNWDGIFTAADNQSPGNQSKTMRIVTTGGQVFDLYCSILVGTKATSVDDLESSHPYDRKYVNRPFWVYTMEGADNIDITFDQQTSLYEGDYIALYNKDGKQVGKYSGTQLAGKTISLKGNTVKIQLVNTGYTTDSAWGFKVTQIAAGNGPTEITSDKYEITQTETGSKVLTGLQPGVKVEEVLQNLDGQELVVKKADGTLLEGSANIGTGCVISMGDDAETSITVVVPGDTTGDGQVNARDILDVRRAILGISSLNDVYLQAATVKSHSESTPSVQDLLTLRRYVLGLDSNLG